MERQIRVLVAIRPRLMRELILTTFSDQPDIEIVGEVVDETKVPDAVDRLSPDFLVLSQDDMGKRPTICDLVLRQHPEVRIVAVSPDRNYSVHYWVSFDIHSHDVEASEEGILGVLRKKSDSLGRVTW
jgi:chemotaxis response regulator CheB